MQNRHKILITLEYALCDVLCSRSARRRTLCIMTEWSYLRYSCFTQFT